MTFRRLGIEYWQHFHEGLFPGVHFTWNEIPALAPKVQLFVVFYWGMTGPARCTWSSAPACCSG